MTVICRVCLCSNRFTYSIIDTVLEGVWEKLTSAKFNIDDGKSLFVCYICFAHLKKSYGLMIKALKAEELLTELINEDVELTEGNISPIANLAYELDYNYVTKLHQDYDYKQFEKDFVEGLGKSSEEEYEKGNESNIYVYIEEEEDTQEIDHAGSCLVNVEMEICSDGNDCLSKSTQQNVLQKEVRIILERIDTDTLTKNNKDAPQESKENNEKNTDDVNLVPDVNLSHPENNNLLCNTTPSRSFSLNSKAEISKRKYKKSITHKSIIIRKQRSKRINISNNINNYIENDIRQSFSKKQMPIATNVMLDETDKANKSPIRNKGSENYLSCPLCQYKTSMKSNMNVHIRTHTGERPYICQFCDHSFVQSNALNRHIRFKHTNMKKYTCHICQYKFVTKANLNIHLRKHTGYKPYECNKCNYSCTQVNNLKRHMQFKHTNVKNFKCHICGFECVEKAYLRKHLRTHTGEKPHRCGYCDYRSSFPSSLVRHLKLVHSFVR